MRVNSLQDLYINELRDLYHAENQLLKALPKMAKAATTPELKEGFQDHLKQTETQVDRLDRIFEKLGRKPTGKKCVGMEGLIEEGKELMKEDVDPIVLDAGLITAAQKVEHYEIAGYGSARTFADMLGYKEASQLLQQTLEEEKQTDQKLTQIAEAKINLEAASGAEKIGE
jgi:ferritin-like metal-binding protein YciE